MVRMTHTELQDKIAEILPRLDAGGWRPIEEAPKDGTEVLVTDGYDIFTAQYCVSNVTNYKPFFATTARGDLKNTGYDWQCEPEYMDVTHFKPLDDPLLKELSDSDAESDSSLCDVSLHKQAAALLRECLAYIQELHDDGHMTDAEYSAAKRVKLGEALDV